MRIRIANKRRFAISCCVFAIIIFNLVFAIGKRLLSYGEAKETVENSVSKGYTLLTASNSGSIILEENNLFRRYILSCENDVSNLIWKETDEFIEIELKKDDIANISVKSNKDAEVKDIYVDKKEDNLSIKIKKNYDGNNLIYVDKNNSKNLVVLVSKVKSPFHHKVVLDAGHGGVDKGTSFGDLYEKDINLSIVNFTADELLFNGFKVVKTRDKDDFLQLAQIGNIVNSSEADVFISIHINDFKESQYNGVSTYYYDPNGYQTDERLKLANVMQKYLIKSDNWFDRGIFKENFQVLRDSKIPCVLLECGFITNSEDREKLTKESVLKNLGINITQGLLDYFDLKNNELE